MWFYENKEFTEDMIGDYVGFVYLIENITNSRKYIGKKLFTKSKTYQKNKKKKRTRVASNWIDYTGSNDNLNTDILSGHQVIKKILYLCKKRAWMSYYETKEILCNDALLNTMYYNDWISARVRRLHLK